MLVKKGIGSWFIQVFIYHINLGFGNPVRGKLGQVFFCEKSGVADFHSRVENAAGNLALYRNFIGVKG